MARLGPRSSIVAGLLVGVATAVVLLGAVVALVPGPSGPTPTDPPSSIASSSPSAAPTAPPASAASSDPASASATPSASGSALFHVGEPAPPLVVPQVGGGTIDLAALRGKPVWVNFMATWCPPCQDELPLMHGFAVRYVEEDLVVLVIDVKEEEGVIVAFAQALDVTLPLGLDIDGRAAETWDAIALPVHFWVDAEGIVRDGSLGGIGPDIMAAGLQTIMPGVDVRP